MEFQLIFTMESNVIYFGISWDLFGFNGNYRQDFVVGLNEMSWEFGKHLER